MKKAIKYSVPVHPSGRSRVIEFPESNPVARSESVIEARLRDLTALVADLTDSGFGVLLSEDAATREAFDELRIKEAALRWIVRVAKHSSGNVREKLWSDIEEAVSGLETTADLLLHSGLTWPHSLRANHQGGLDSSWRS